MLRVEEHHLQPGSTLPGHGAPLQSPGASPPSRPWLQPRWVEALPKGPKPLGLELRFF